MFELLLGHLVGDYLFQTKWMAINKHKYNLTGWLAATVHCIIYTLSVCLIMWNFQPIWMLAVFLSHFPIDKFSLGEIYLKYVKNNSLRDYIDYRWAKHNREDIVKGSFNTIIYVVTDNTMHLLIMWGAYKLIY